jgi:formylglycine-generating enzyme required for sulfatase activity
MSWNRRIAACLVLFCLNLSALALVPLRSRPWEDEAATTKLIENSLGMKLIRIEPGTFMMGSPMNEEGRNDNEQQHLVDITRPFYMGKYEVTQAEYEKVIGKNPSEFRAARNGQAQDPRRFPVEMVSWNDAKEFCGRLTQMERQAGRITSAMEYTLPTEAEWEYCCRAGTKTQFHVGATISTEQANFNGTTVYGNGNPGIARSMVTPVGSFPPNPWGLCDMHGNVCEWCEDWHDGTYYPVSPRKDPTGPKDGSIRMLRGGSWTYRPHDCRSALRDGIDAGYRGNFCGFRVVLRLTPKS